MGLTMNPRIRAALKTSNALILGPLLAWLGAKIILSTPQVLPATQAFQYVQTFAVIFTVLCNYSAWWLFRKRIKYIKEIPERDQRIDLYVKASSSRFLLFVMALTALVLGYTLTLHWSLTALVFTQALLMFLQRPHPWVAAVQMGYHRQALYESQD